MVDWEPVVIQLVMLAGEDKAKDAKPDPLLAGHIDAEEPVKSLLLRLGTVLQ